MVPLIPTSDEFSGNQIRELTWANPEGGGQGLQLRENNQNLVLDALKDPLIERVLFNTNSYVFAEIKEKSPAQKAHNVGPSKDRQRYAISLAYRCWAVNGPTLCASLVETL